MTRWNNMKRGSKKATTTEKLERRKTVKHHTLLVTMETIPYFPKVSLS